MPRKLANGKRKVLDKVIAIEKQSRIKRSQPKPDRDTHYYSMLCYEGKYESSSWLGLGWAIFTHRLWHLWNHGRWMD